MVVHKVKLQIFCNYMASYVCFHVKNGVLFLFFGEEPQ